MPTPYWEVPSGVVNNANTLFTVSRAYKPGSTAVFVNGQLLPKTWTESSPGEGEVTLDGPPEVGASGPDTLQVFYLDTTPLLPGFFVERLQGTVVPAATLVGDLAQVILVGVVDETWLLTGSVTPAAVLGGTLEPVQELFGEIGVC